MLSSSDQRKHSRFDGSPLGALLTFEGSAHPETSIENVSLGGALVTVDCAPPLETKVQLALWRMGRPAVKLVGRVIAVEPGRRGHPQPSVRIGFAPHSEAVIAQLYSMISDLPFEMGERDIVDVPAEQPDDEPAIDLIDVIDDEAMVRMAMEEALLRKQLRIEELERQLRRMRRGARSLESLLIPAALAS